MANIVITWNASPVNVTVQYDENGDVVQEAISAEKPIKITGADGIERILDPGKCIGLSADITYTVERVDG